MNSSRGKNVKQTAKKVSMTTTDQINQQTVASYLQVAVRPTYKMLPKSWRKLRDDKRSLCQMILNNKPIGAAPRWHFFGGGEGGVWAKKGVTLRGLRISEKKEILRKPTVL